MPPPGEKMASEKENTELVSENGIEGSDEIIEERVFSAALICLEGHFTQSPPMGPKTAARVTSMVSKTLEKTHTLRRVRETLSRNVEIWIWLTRILAASIPTLTARSVGPLSSLNDPEKGVSPHESTALIVMNYDSIKNDLSILTKLMHIARNLLVNAEPQVPQDICAAVHFDQMVYQTIILCVNVTSKGYDGEILDEADRLRLAEITELYKKLLVTSLQQAHNWTAKHDRNKMSFWFDVLFDDDGALNGHDETVADCSGFRPEVAKQQVQHWLDRNSKMCDTARQLLRHYAEHHASKPPGNLAPIRPLAWNWLPEGSVDVPLDEANDDKTNPVWKFDETDKFEQDRAYGRVSREIDTWWLKSRDPNYEEWIVGMPSVESAQSRTEHCKTNLIHRYSHSYRDDNSLVPDGVEDDISEHDHCPNYDDESYGDGPLTGLLTEVPNILDPKQIEALHMIVKSCIFDSSGSGTTRSGENLQRTRCRMFLALDCGKSLLRELLVFIAVWDKEEESLIYQVTMQIVDAIHRNALIPYAWNSLRISKDIISPAQTVLLRLVTDMLGGRTVAGGSAARDGPAGEGRDGLRDLKLVHFFFSSFRSRIVPECAALMHLQAQIREEKSDASEFPVDTWDMERAKDGLAQYLDFLKTVAEMPDMRLRLIEWEAVYDLVTVLSGVEAAVPKKPLVHVPRRNGGAGDPMVERPYAMAAEAVSAAAGDVPSPTLEPAHKFPWAGIKSQIFIILATLLQPPPDRHSPGNPAVQMQMVRYDGIGPLLSSTAYDDHNPYAKERVTICLKWLLDGCEEANDFIRQLNRSGPEPNLKPPAGGTATQTLRVDGVEGDVRVKVRSNRPRVVEETEDVLGGGQAATVEDSSTEAPRNGASIEDDFMA
ncbi:hypothetical protein LMH87_011358 [Akanthomyces muscarius]|uniref:Ataxin-10 homolog n=1 Tax=Akanthomyces muscarius TaxID=2231603 RepID=A0A9W8QAH2_AKAMU|nr:hypothetical protein LMH87_011358 [Akanthomyces muscarius]KAJ4150616.1 hypothetical protein LMH87_011358 [Akanthomyces muscarius]